MRAWLPCQSTAPSAKPAISPDDFRVFEAEISPGLTRLGRVKTWIDCRQQPRQPIFFRDANMQVRMQCALLLVGHQDFHLTERQIFNAVIFGTSFLDICLAAGPHVFISFPDKPSARDVDGALLLGN